MVRALVSALIQVTRYFIANTQCMDDTKSHNFMYTVHSDFFISQKCYWWSGWTLRNLGKVLGQLLCILESKMHLNLIRTQVLAIS
jgi:hypothetical protein